MINIINSFMCRVWRLIICFLTFGRLFLREISTVTGERTNSCGQPGTAALYRTILSSLGSWLLHYFITLLLYSMAVNYIYSSYGLYSHCIKYARIRVFTDLYSRIFYAVSKNTICEFLYKTNKPNGVCWCLYC